MKRVLVTGGGGYVGSALVPHLIEKGFHVTVLDWFLYKKDLFDKYSNDKCSKIVGDIRNIKDLKKSLTSVDTVIHLACISNDPSAELNPKLSLDINQNAFKSLLDECRKVKIDRFIFASSSSIYGISDSPQVYEDHPKVPVSLYNISKAWCEDLLYNEYKDIPFTIVRPATICGYSERLRLDLAVNLLTSHCIQNKKINIFGGEQYRPNLHINDMINLYSYFLEIEEKKILHQVFNASYKNMTINEISEEIISQLKPEIGNILVENVKSDDPRSYRVNTDKLSSVGFDPKFTIKDATKDLHKAFINGKIKKSVNDPIYNNVLMMKSKNII
tara:strand:- start:129 stop:1118 length:990 start_codon:yes stop_codon:yes gene_type:complete